MGSFYLSKEGISDSESKRVELPHQSTFGVTIYNAQKSARLL